MSLSWLRRTVLAVCAAGVAGMIASAVADSAGAALTFGLTAAVAVVCLMVATAVGGAQGGSGGAVDEQQAARVEEAVGRLIAAEADEAAVRRLVREAVRLGRSGGTGR